VLAATVRQVPVHRLVGDVQPSARGKPVELDPGPLPREGGPGRLVVPEIRGDGPRLSRLPDRVPAHGRPRLPPSKDLCHG
jgi:hypothetical protein